jgi:2'-5' RNA ligase
MASQPERPAQIPGKSKTGLRRGQFTPGNPLAKKAPTPRHDTTTTNAEQALLFDEPDQQCLPPKYRLFVGIFPSSAALESMSHLQVELSNQLELRGKFRPRNHLHVTLHCIGDYAEVTERTIQTVAEACAAAFTSQSSLAITFDHAMSFRGSLSFVLVNSNGNESLMKLHHRLITELAKRKLAGRGDFKFVPHVTLLYDRENVPKRPVSPVSWKANEVVLVLSYLGETKYERLQCWPLSD